jgi:iron complex transport system permease protein
VRSLPVIGAALSVSGAVFQSMFINPLVSPGLLGVLAGASFGAAVGMILGKNWFIVQLGAFFFRFARRVSGNIRGSPASGRQTADADPRRDHQRALFTSLLSLVKYLADPYEQLTAILCWLMGGLSFVDKVTVAAASGPILRGIFLLVLLSNHLNVLGMGDEEARSLGLNVVYLRLVFIFLATVISALTVVMGGVIGWVGLLIPHIARMIVGPDNRILLPAAALIGASYLADGRTDETITMANLHRLYNTSVDVLGLSGGGRICVPEAFARLGPPPPARGGGAFRCGAIL